MCTMLVDEHKPRFYSRHNIFPLVLVMVGAVCRGCFIFKSIAFTCQFSRVCREKRCILLVNMAHFGVEFVPLFNGLFRLIVGRSATERVIVGIILQGGGGNMVVRIEHRNVGTPVGIEINSRHIVKHTECIFHGS